MRYLTPRKRAEGLGAARMGTGHHIAMTVSGWALLFIVPVFYNLLARFTKSPEHMARRIEAFEEAEQARVANAAE